MTDGDHKPRTNPFLPGEITLLVEHGIPFLQLNWNIWLAALSDNFKLKIKPPDPDAPFSNVIPLSSDGVGASLVHIALETSIFDNLPAVLTPEEEEKLYALVAEYDIETIKTINALNAPTEPFVREGIILQAAAPNWIFGGSNHTVWDGGPGGRPVKVDEPSSKSKSVFNTVPTQAAIDDSLQASEVNPASAARQSQQTQVETPVILSQRDVNVVILDTAPTATELDSIHPSHALWQTLKDKLTVIRASDMKFQLPKTPIEDKKVHYTHKDAYKMSDHGTFIAGTVHTCTDQANIILVEVLNAFGVGSTDTIARAVAYLTQDMKGSFSSGSALIVNCSLCVGFKSLDDLKKMGLDPHLDSKGSLDKSKVLQPIRAAFDAIQAFSSSNQLDLRITAAAGNNSDPNDPNIGIIEPCYPAAFPDVTGVGSCDDSGRRSWYSNKVDEPPSDGVLVFGGVSSNLTGTSITDGVDGMLGMYIGEFPIDPQPTSTGWARWSGTSFATGLMSGILANAAVQGVMIAKDADPAKDFINRFQAQAKHITSDHESIVYTQQG